jgi:hypothetical protein
MRHISLLLLVFTLSYTMGAQDNDAPDAHVACDNSGTPDSPTRYHTCDCNRAHEECHPGEERSNPTAKCKTYCKEDHCSCSTRSCS